jgi:hypothetical protein
MNYIRVFFFKKTARLIIVMLCFSFAYSCNRTEKLEITVPIGYIGEICLVKSNVTTNELLIDSNGIGYINETTYENQESQPIVHDASGKDLTSNCVGYNPSSFWALGEYKSLEPKIKIKYLGFEIVPDSLKGRKQYFSNTSFKLVDTLKIK